jgi:hypothetical protein
MRSPVRRSNAERREVDRDVIVWLLLRSWNDVDSTQTAVEDEPASTSPCKASVA